MKAERSITMDEKYTGSCISRIRKEKGWTQKDLAERLHVSATAVSKWERGLNFPDISLLQPLAEELGISVAQLMGLENESVEKAVQTVTQFSANEKEKTDLKNKKRLLMFFAILATASIIGTLIIIIGSSDSVIPSIGFMEKLFRTGLLNLLAIGLGICAWVFGVLAFFSDKKIHSLFSFLFCTISVYIPVLITDLQVRFGDYAALEDTIWGYHFAAIVLLLGTSFLNSASFVRFFRTVRMQKTPSASKQTEL